ncbi:integrase, catalytic region, zinc finger, CCHC-type containing protein [Tanacetum coccineum]
MSQEVLLTVMNSMSLVGESVNMDGKRKETCNLEAELLKSQNAFNDLLKRHSQLEKHCISLEFSIQLNQEIFQKRESCNHQNALEILEFFAYNDLKAQLQDKDNTICKNKNVELENSVAKLLSKNERLCNEINHVKQVFKEQFDSTKKTCVRSKEQSDSLIDKLNLKSAENEDLKVQIQDKLDLKPLAHRLLKNREAHIDYLKYTQEQADILQEIVEQAKAERPLDKELDFALLKGLKCSTSKCGSKPTGNKRNDRISQTPSRNMKNKVEAQPRKVNKKNCVVKPVHDVNVKHSLLHANSEPVCDTYIPSSSSSVMTGTVRFGNDHIVRIMGYDDYHLGNVTISRVYYVEGLGHNLFSVGQFCDEDLEVTKSWLWHRRLSHLNFGTINKLAKDGLARGIPRLKFQKDHLCSACALGKSKKSSHQPKAKDTNQEKLYLLHMDLYGPMQAIAPRAVDLADYPMSTSIDKDAPSSSTPSTQEQEQSLIISQGFEESPKTPIFHDDPLNESPHEESTSQGSSSNVRQIHTPFEHLGRWTKDHPITNVIGDPSRSVSTRKQLQTDAMWCFFDAFLTSVEPKNFKQAMSEPSWIDAMQE